MCLVSYSKKEQYSSKNKLNNFDNSPKWAYVEITSSCSHKCAWCYGGFNEDKQEYMSVEDFETLANKCVDIGIKQVTLSGGEPTEHPYFKEILAIACQHFTVNIATHGDWTEDFSGLLYLLGVKQVQFNYQGSKRHDGVHKVDSYQKQLESMKSVKKLGIDVVGTVTVGAYNLRDISDIFKELDTIGVSRLRVWEATGVGNKFRKELEAKQIFDHCTESAAKFGYTYIQSYDPIVEGDVGVKCLSLSKLYMYINSKCQVIYCGAVESELDKPFSDFKTDSPKEILTNYINYMDSKQRDKPYCAARSEE